MEVIVVLILGTMVTIGLALASLNVRTPMQRRIARLVDGSAAQIESVEPGGMLEEPQRGLFVRLFTPLASRAGSLRASGPIRERLIQAGYRRSSAVSVFMGTRVVLALLVPGVLALVPTLWTLAQLQLVALLCAGAGVGYVAPSYWIDRRLKARARQIELGLPDALDLMVVCVEAGLGINASLARVAQEFGHSRPVLSAEFELVTLEVRAGKSMSEALRSFADRTGVGQISSLVAMLIQTERFGTNLADTLRVHADAMRVRRLQSAEEQAAKAPLKMLFPTVLIFIATLLVTVGPGVIQMMEFFTEQELM